MRDTSNPPSVEGEHAAELCDWSNRGLQDRRASAKNAEIKWCGWVAHILFSM